ncbi:unknown similar to AMEV132 [Choristoneura rosaceana entomopoxvirus 'L']|uniref:KilA-N domain-containing protein n=1 Tax=Choristoneura rosaceana entomopoxvirus 'L' TaxID=1293539 RepID=A0ABM9QKI2_9POXV|nr:unknown similar to AMEV132 [Choristoneura rosaceana entomopoxvirus 'L']CCU56053.1 unknown similar to AMEV132 [Choristoneura rosaceana entomopoxvirus 'L']
MKFYIKINYKSYKFYYYNMNVLIKYNIKNDYIYLTMNNFNIICNKKTKLFNATRLCETSEKDVYDWLKENYKMTMSYLQIDNKANNIYMENDNNKLILNGLYVNKYILLAISIWISYDYYIRCLNIMIHTNTIDDNKILEYTTAYLNLNVIIIINKNDIKSKINDIMNNINDNDTITRKYILNNIKSNLNKYIIWYEIKNILNWKNSKLPIHYNYKTIYIKY